MSRFLRGRVIEAPSEKVAKRAGDLLGRTGTSDAADAIVVATAIEQQAGTIVTSDPGDLITLINASDSAYTPLVQKV